MKSTTSLPMLVPLLFLSTIATAAANPLLLERRSITLNQPTVTLSTSNISPKTIFVGRSLPEFNQDVFLGIKYADKPLRFTPAKLKSAYTSKDSESGAYNPPTAGISTAPSSVYYNATAYGHDCPGYGSDTTNLVNKGLITLNEDCLNINIVRPKPHHANSLLPVIIWIFGGGWTQGATADPRYVHSKSIVLGTLVVICQDIRLT
jgi:acetylcholinesterase